MNEEQAAALRAPFPQDQIGYIPKGGVQLAYVGHAHVTDRLLQVDPGWWWEPLGVDDHGLPVLDEQGNLWGKLHLCDTVTIGVGDGPTMKERISDLVRNCAMRRGVALDLWAKETHGGATPTRPVSRSKPSHPEPDHWSTDPPQGVDSPPSVRPGGPPATSAQIKLIHVLMKDAGTTERDAILDGIGQVIGRVIDSSKELTKAEAGQVINALQVTTND